MLSDAAAIAPFLDFAHKLADRAGEIIRPYYLHDISVTNKSKDQTFDPVTEADRAAETTMREMIAAEYPEHGIYGEEFTRKSTASPFTWTLDPIDGSRAFMIGLPAWGTLIGLNQEFSPVLGVMDQPYTRDRFWSDGTTSYFRDRDGTARTIKTRACPSLGDAVMAATRPAQFRDGFEQDRFAALSAQARTTHFGGACYLYCLLAMGLVDLVAECNVKPHDIAPVIPIIRAAGGVVTTWDGGDAAHAGRVVAAGDPALHEQALRVLAG